MNIHLFSICIRNSSSLVKMFNGEINIGGINNERNTIELLPTILKIFNGNR